MKEANDSGDDSGSDVAPAPHVMEVPGELERMIEHAAHLLPTQGPITEFVHHNTLHAFEDLCFEEAVKVAADKFGCEPYLTEETFRQLVIKGRILPKDISETLLEDLGEYGDVLLGFLGTRFHLREVMLNHWPKTGPAAELEWLVAETDALRKFQADVPESVKDQTVGLTRHWVMRDVRNGGGRPAALEGPIGSIFTGLFQSFDASVIEEWTDETWESFCLHLLWKVCLIGAGHADAQAVETPLLRHRDALLKTTGRDSDLLVDDVMTRRFESAPLTLRSQAALRHVEGRSEDLSQVRPEAGHATNSICIVGDRAWSRGLFLDRRAFLCSYDHRCDDEMQTVLSRILQAVIPVCAGINLEYYFSFVDPIGYGCSTKLPHNIVSLLGVMNGTSGDLIPGLPWQMVEIHEPVRLLLLVETSPEVLQRVVEQHESLYRLCHGEWIQLATIDPETSRIHLLRDGSFESFKSQVTSLPTAKSSADWYRGWRDHLGFASIRKE